jgi:prepilin-type N-terminal cleavage/methylation domain-containing protein
MRFFLPQHEKGFTLIELTIAATVLAIGILGYTLLKSSNQYSREYSKETSQCIQLIRGQLEEFLSMDYNSTLLTAGTHDYTEIDPVNPLRIGDFQIAGTDAQWVVSDGCPSQYTKTIDFTATWGEGTKQLTLTHVMVMR